MSAHWGIASTIQISIFSAISMGVIDLDAEIAHGGFNFGMSEQKLYRSEVPRPPVDQHRLRAPLIPSSA
jgi:hypothetical protein